jgi:hypothetical protein
MIKKRAIWFIAACFIVGLADNLRVRKQVSTLKEQVARLELEKQYVVEQCSFLLGFCGVGR